MNEARRYHYPLSVVVLSPMIMSIDTSSEDRVRQGALAAKAAARSTDLVGWLDGGDILVVLPHTSYTGALAAIERWHTEMNAQPSPTGTLKWLAAALEHADEFATARGLLSAACHRFRETD